jgi:aarF domain-containing kinase
MQRVQDSADYMPASQRDKVLIRNLGPDWRKLFSEFADRPFAAASIGQVHKATLKSNGQEVAVKIQYPGVRNSIDSDLNNLSLLLTASQLLPRGLFLDKTIANARTELGWECDYTREAQSCTHFQALLADEPDTFAVPTVYPEASGPDVLTASFMHGVAVAKIPSLTPTERDHIGSSLLRLCLRELMEWQFMQTDPNWTNFLYNRHTSQIELLDFGASRAFPSSFIEPYISLLIAASRGDRPSVQEYSIQLGYLTGRESPAMLRAHVDSIFVLAEPFSENAPERYDFENQTITERVRVNIGLMLRERMAPPPEETYSLHRKLSGAFLLCAKLRSKVPAREMFRDAVRRWEGRGKGGGGGGGDR